MDVTKAFFLGGNKTLHTPGTNRKDLHEDLHAARHLARLRREPTSVSIPRSRGGPMLAEHVWDANLDELSDIRLRA
jgi:hypothetical protein